jgi:hypothetical protein
MAHAGNALGRKSHGAQRAKQIPVEPKFHFDVAELAAKRSKRSS